MKFFKKIDWKNTDWKEVIQNYSLILLGTFIMAIGFVVFISPLKLAVCFCVMCLGFVLFKRNKYWARFQGIPGVFSKRSRLSARLLSRCMACASPIRCLISSYASDLWSAPLRMSYWISGLCRAWGSLRSDI